MKSLDENKDRIFEIGRESFPRFLIGHAYIQ